MSVKVVNRNLSRCEAVFRAVELKEVLDDLCLRDFGIKDLNHIVRLKYAHGKEEYEDYDKYYSFLTQCKKRMYSLTDELIANTRAANRTRLNSLMACDRRKQYQEKAIDNCEMLISKLQQIGDVFWIDFNKTRRYVKLVDEEEKRIKKWEAFTDERCEKLIKQGMV